MKKFIRGASRSATNARMWKRAGLISIILALTVALAVGSSGPAGAQAPPQAAKLKHTQNLTEKHECVNGVLNVTYTLAYQNGVPNGDIFRRTGTTTFQNNWNPGTWSDWTKVATVTTAQGSKSWTVQLPGDTKVAPWEYAYIKWSDGVVTQGDRRPEDLKGDCKPTAVKDASASVSITPATCDSPEKLVLGQAVNATWGTPTRTTGPGSFSVVATGNAGPPQHLFNSGPGVSTDGKTQTFTGDLKGKDTSQNCWAKDAAASVMVSPGTCKVPGSASVAGLQYATLVGTLDQSVGDHVATFQSTPPHLFPNGTDTLQVSYTVPGKDTSVECVPPAVYHPRATVHAYCVTRHWGEGIARLINRQSTQSVRYHIVRSGKDRFVTVGAGKNRRIELNGLRVGSVVKVKVGKNLLSRDKVEPGCGHAPPPNTGERKAAG